MRNNYLILDAHSDMLNYVLPKRRAGKKKVIINDWLDSMQIGGISTRIVAIYNDRQYLPELALRRGLDQVAMLYQELEESPQRIMLCTNTNHIRKAKKTGKIGFILGMEGVEPLGQDIQLLRIFHALGLRIVGLTHANINYAGIGAPLIAQKSRLKGGLTEFGLSIIGEAKKLGLVIDVSHINEDGFWDTIESTENPVIASHSNCRALCNHPRCLTDKQIKAISDKEGVIGLTPIKVFVDKDGKKANIDRFFDHIDHAVEVGGIRSVGIGLDFCDYLIKFLSEDEKHRLPDVSAVDGISSDLDVPKIAEGLIERGYNSQQVELILGENFMRVFEHIWK